MAGTRYWLAVAAAVLLSAGASALLIAPDRGSAYAGSGSCSGGSCDFCTDITLTKYGSGSPDRCAYGRFYKLYEVSNIHSSGATQLCAGAKDNRDGSGGNATPLGFACSSNNLYVFRLGDLQGRNTEGYATIANGDNVTHYHFRGTAHHN
jgi:hypothetical protein